MTSSPGLSLQNSNAIAAVLVLYLVTEEDLWTLWGLPTNSGILQPNERGGSPLRSLQ